jgi:hypothetical protein
MARDEKITRFSPAFLFPNTGNYEKRGSPQTKAKAPLAPQEIRRKRDLAKTGSVGRERKEGEGG